MVLNKRLILAGIVALIGLGFGFGVEAQSFNLWQLDQDYYIPNFENIRLGSSTDERIFDLNASTADIVTLTISGISGSTQCLTADSNGLVSGTGSACGAGGGGVGGGAFTTTTESGITIIYPTEISADVIWGSDATGTAEFWWDESANLLTLTGDLTVAGPTILATTTVNKNFSISADGSTPANPRVGAFSDLSAGEYVRFEFGDEHNAFANGYANDLQIYSYWALELVGGRQNYNAGFYGLPPNKITDAGVIIRSDTAGVGNDPSSTLPVTTFVVQATSTQWANLIALKDSDGSVMSVVDSSGRFNIGTGVTSTDYLQVVGGAKFDNATSTNSFNVNNNFMVDSSGNIVVDGTALFNGVITADDDLTFNDEILPGGSLCTNNQILRKTGADDWRCADEAAATVLDYFLSNVDSGFTDTNIMYDSEQGQAESSHASSTLPEGDDQLLFTFMTASTSTVPSFLLPGVYDIHAHFDRTGGNRTTTLYWTLTASSTDDTQTVLMTSEDSAEITNTKAAFTFHAVLAIEIDLTTGDRLVLKIYGDLGSGANTEITIFYDGDTDSHLAILTTSEVFNAIYLRQDGTKELTANWNAGSFDITASTFIGALTGNADTATALAANGGNCSAGNSPLGVDTLAAVENCFDVWTEAENTSADYLTRADFYSTTTEEIAEGGTNFYYSTQLFAGDLNSTDTDALSEGSNNFYYTEARWNSSMNGTGTLDVDIVGDVTGALTGNAQTATALAADPNDCAGSGWFAKGIVANGSSTCALIVDADIPDDITLTEFDPNVDTHGEIIAIIDNTATDVGTGVWTFAGITLAANENITLGGQTLNHDGTDFVFNDTISASTGSKIGNLTLGDGSITDSGGAISFNDENLISTGNATFTALALSGLTNCDTIDTDGVGNFVCGSDADSGGGGGENFFTWNEAGGYIYPSTTTDYLVIDAGSMGIGTTTINFSLNDASSTVAIGGYRGELGDFSTVVGYKAGQSLVDSVGGITAFGYQALKNNSSGWGENSAFGVSALRSVTSGDINTGIGWAVGQGITTGSRNVIVGGDTYPSNATGTRNTVMGVLALRVNKYGDDNVAIGESALGGLINGSNNVAIGSDAASGTDATFSNSVVIGANAGKLITTGGNNIILGYQAGNSLTSGGSNIIIGYDIEAPSNTASNQLNIGNLIFGTGIDGTGTNISSGNVGIATSTPEARLVVGNNGLGFRVNDDGNVTSTGLRLTNITGSTQCLHVDTNGEVSGTGSDCGAGGGGSNWLFDNTHYAGPILTSSSSQKIWIQDNLHASGTDNYFTGTMTVGGLVSLASDLIVSGNSTTTGDVAIGADGANQPGCIAIRGQGEWGYGRWDDAGNTMLWNTTDCTGAATSTLIIGR